MNRNRRLLAAVPALLLLLSTAGAAAPSAALAPAAPDFDREARIEEVRKAELAFAASVLDNRPDRFAAALDEGAVFVGGGVSRGKAAVIEGWQGYFAEGRPYFEWHPEVVELSADGELGLSRGPWTIRGKNKDGKEVEQKGTFNSVWRRQADGSWRVIFDAGCSPCPACGG